MIIELSTTIREAGKTNVVEETVLYDYIKTESYNNTRTKGYTYNQTKRNTWTNMCLCY